MKNNLMDIVILDEEKDFPYHEHAKSNGNCSKEK